MKLFHLLDRFERSDSLMALAEDIQINHSSAIGAVIPSARPAVAAFLSNQLDTHLILVCGHQHRAEYLVQELAPWLIFPWNSFPLLSRCRTSGYQPIRILWPGGRRSSTGWLTARRSRLSRPCALYCKQSICRRRRVAGWSCERVEVRSPMSSCEAYMNRATSRPIWWKKLALTHAVAASSMCFPWEYLIRFGSSSWATMWIHCAYSTQSPNDRWNGSNRQQFCP